MTWYFPPLVSCWPHNASCFWVLLFKVHSWRQQLPLLHWCSKEDVFPIMLNNVTGDLRRNWVTHEKSKPMAVWCGGSDGFVCLWLSKSAHKHWHRDLAWTLPHKCRLAHATLTSSLRFFLFLPPLPLSVPSHTNVQSEWLFQHTSGGGTPCEFIKQFECDYVNELCLIHATVWTSGVHAGCDKLHSLTAVYVCGLWLLNHLIVWEWLHLNSSHGPPKVTECFIKLEEVRGGMCTF